MGSDIVEIILALKEEFGVEIPHNVASRLVTPGQVHTYIVRQMRQQARAVCPANRIFYELRRGAFAAGLCLREVFRPSTSIERLVPVRLERRDANARSSRSQTPRPDLEQQARMEALMRSASFTGALVAGGWSALLFSRLLETPAAAWIFSPAVALATGFGLRKGLRRIFNSDEPFESARPTEMEIEEHAVWRRVRRVIAIQLGRNEDEITRDADFSRDLGVG